MRYAGRPVAERFWPKVDLAGECWQWTASVDHSGYGQINVGGGGKVKMARAHRVSWEIQRGPIPAGLAVLHRCDSRYPPGDFRYRRCVNPAHLFLGTVADNNRDMFAKGRHRSNGPRGERHPHAKLTADQVREIRRAWPEIRNLCALGRRYGVTHKTIERIVKGRGWREIT